VKPPIGLGDDWLAMTPAERASTVDMFIGGWNVGSIDTCWALLGSISVDAWPGRGKTPPADLCNAATKQFTHVNLATGDVSAYTSVIDTFYSHPECRTMPYGLLLEHLNDAEYKPGEQFYQYVRSGLVWGHFTGPNGFEKCYGAALNRNFGG